MPILFNCLFSRERYLYQDCTINTLLYGNRNSIVPASSNHTKHAIWAECFRSN